MTPASTASRLSAAFALLAASAAPVAHAADTCMVSTQPVVFGVYDPIATAPLQGTGTVTVECTGNPHDVQVALSPGNSGTYAARHMSSGATTLGYNLYLDLAHTRVFGDGSGGSFAAQCKTGTNSGNCLGFNPSGSLRTAVLSFHALLPAGQDVAPGDYADLVQVVVTF